MSQHPPWIIKAGPLQVVPHSKQLCLDPKVTPKRAPVQQVHCWSGLGTGPGKGIQTILLSRPAQQLTAVLEGSSNEA